MAGTRQNLLVGIFVLVGLSALGALIVLFGRGTTGFLGGAGYPLIIEFESATGIRAGNPVTLRGIRVGRVETVSFAAPSGSGEGFRPHVEVRVMIDAEHAGQIPVGSRAVATEPAFGQGRPPIEILPGPAGLGTLKPGDRILEGQIRGAMDAMVPESIRFTFERTAAQVGESAAALTPVLRDLHEVLMKRSPGEVDRAGGLQGNLSTAMARFDGSLKHVNDVLGDPEVKSRLKEAIDNFHALSEDGKAAVANLRAGSEEAQQVVREAKELVVQTRGTVERLDGEVTQVCRDARGALEQGSQMLGALNEAAGSIKRGDGTIGRLVRDPKLYEALVLTIERLAQTVEEFRLLIKDWQEGKIRVAL